MDIRRVVRRAIFVIMMCLGLISLILEGYTLMHGVSLFAVAAPLKIQFLISCAYVIVHIVSQILYTTSPVVFKEIHKVHEYAKNGKKESIVNGIYILVPDLYLYTFTYLFSGPTSEDNLR